MQRKLQIGRGLLSGAMLAAVVLACLPGWAQGSANKQEGPTNTLPTILNRVGIDQNLNRQLPLDATFTDETGKTVKLGDYFNHGKPAILAVVYYTCPMLCSEELEGLTSALEMVRYQPGRDFNVIAVSIDATDTPAIAAGKKQLYTHRFGHPESDYGWHFLTGTQPNIDAVTDAVGFHAVRVPGPDGKLSQFAHTSAIQVVTTQGRLAQYFYGVEYSPKDILFALSQASGGKVGSPVEALVLYCFHYDPHTGHYSLIVARVVQAACLLTVFMLGGFMMVMFRKDANEGKKEKQAANRGRDSRHDG
jgi:protein SCO1/2